MRNVILCIFCLLLSAISIAQSSMCENGYLPFQDGLVYEMSSYNAKGKLSGIVKSTIEEITQVSDGFRATMHSEIFDEKSKPTYQTSYTIECRGNALSIDMSSLLNPEMLASMSSMDVTFTGDAMEVPNDLTPGQQLPDAGMQMEASMNGMALLKMKINITDRKVGDSERITTPAGTFDCVKMTQTTVVEGPVKSMSTSTSWLAKGIGAVRTENYDKKGEMNSYSELTRLDR